MNEHAASSRNLVVVRAGPDSLHPKWLSRKHEERRFDLVVSYYQRDCFDQHEESPGVNACYYPGGKWDGLHQTLSELGEALETYDFIWLPDDDIETSADDIGALFEAMRETGLKIGQPSLTANSFFTHFLFINCPGIAVRWTNYVEIMVPCLHLSVLREVLPDFRATMSGYGLDYIWCRLPGVGPREAGIIDRLQVRHTRPVGSALSHRLAESGTTPKVEQALLDSAFGVTEPVTPLVYGLRTESGREVDGLLMSALFMAGSHLSHILRTPSSGRRYGMHRVYQLVRRQLTRRLDLSPLERGQEQQQNSGGTQR
jgi:hypothetical protein